MFWPRSSQSAGKLSRAVKEIQGHMRLRASGDRHEIRQQYLPSLWSQLIRPLNENGKDAVPEVIELMDSYYLTREDWDSILELGLGPMDMESVKLDTQTKSTFTRIYNAASHPMPFMKASSIAAPKKVGREKPDLEEAIDESDEGEEVLGEDEVKKEEDDAMDLKKDKYIKAPKKKPAAKVAAAPKKAAATKKGKKAKEESEESEEDSEEDVKPKKGRGAGAGRGGAGRGRGRGKK